MLIWERWREKSKSSLEAAQILLERNKPVEAASRSYYAAYQMVTGVLLKLNLTPRSDFGNWSHRETLKLYQIHICQKSALSFKEKRALKNLFPKFLALLEARYLSDYGDSKVNPSLATSHWRVANLLMSLLNSFINRGLL